MKFKLRHVALYATLTLLGCGPAYSATVLWTNLAGGNWNAATNWSPNQVPDNADSAVITNSGTYTIQVFSVFTVGQLQLGGGAGTQTVQIAAGFPSSSILTVNSGFTNAGMIELVSGAGGWAPMLNVNNGTLVNTGTIQVKPGTGGLSTLSANLDNRGRMTRPSSTMPPASSAPRRVWFPWPPTRLSRWVPEPRDWAARRSPDLAWWILVPPPRWI